MQNTRAPISKRVAAHRERQTAAGRAEVSAYMSVELVAEIDRIKQERGASSRAPILEEAVRLYIEQTRA
ncbi:ribbon-helix-helix protein, CopG family [Agrobacterium sp. DKPNP3]|uniref:ribbon-helix-helix protein, CopG family n=1 Tax=Agrobacterium TaxID=357 RepID=UPI000EB9D54E|nr:hypothetical protein [Agrobacterium sp.]